MKIIKYLTVILALIVGITQCKLPDNVNPKRATQVPVETLFTNAEVALFNMIDDVNVNRNVLRLYVQYWNETTYFDESRYLMQDRQIPDNYVTRFYRDVLMDLKEARDIVLEDDLGDPAGQKNKAAILDILMAQAWLTVVDGFGDLPYTQALQMNENTQPVYDDAASIYDAEINNLKTAINSLGAGSSWGAADVMYNGDISLWKKYGASLLLRVGMRLADVSPDKAKSAVQAALDAGVYTTEADAGFLHYIGVVPHVNAIYNAYVVDNRKDYLPTNTIIDIMGNYEGANYDLGGQDPRIDNYFTLAPDTNVYIGAIAGLDGAQSYQLFSHFQDVFFEPTFPAMIIDYIEVEFWLAEAAQRSFPGVSGSAEEHYNNAITASILYWGGTQDEVDAYLALPGVAYDAANWKERLGVQKWIALYNRGIEAWAEWKRLDYPILNIPEGMTYNDIPLRFVYPYNEVLQNRENYEAASQKIGGDKVSSPLFWDVNPSPAAK